MLALLRRLRAVRSTGERGVALAMVVGIAAVLLVLITFTMSFSVSGLVRSNHDADWDAAMSAAFAGVAEYQGRLTNDPSYQQYGNPSSPFTIANGSKTSVTLPTGSNANPAFDVTKNGTWAKVPLSDGLPANASFRYEVDNSKYASNGVIHLRATGRVDNVTRSVVANVKQTGFTNYVYFTDFEELDPTLNSGSKCPATYAWAATRSTSCLINFIPGDTFDGQVHSNDTLNICGGTFKQRVTTANPTRNSSGNLYSATNCSSGSATPTFSAGAPANSALITMPPPQAQLDQVRTDIPAKVPNPGCLYTGPTQITFSVDSSGNATMTVYSPWTKYTQLGSADATSASVASYCGTPGDPSKSQTANKGTLSGSGGQTIAIGSSTQLYNNLVYVQAIPATTSNKNSWASGKSPNNNTLKCVGADNTTAGNSIGYPIANEVVGSVPTYSCTAGDVFVQGTMHGSMTITAENYAWITGKLSYQDSANDMLGLVGAGAVWVYNPIICTNPSTWPSSKYSSCSATKSGISWESGSCQRTINAAILSNYHSFEVQNYNSGIYVGYLCVKGSIAQEYRGPVGQSGGSGGTSGFLKSYSYDTRLLNSPPPKFPTPRTTSYDVTTEIEVKTAFGPDGSPLS